ncbi:MAG: hypothetical protein HY742_05160 [Deltaproteobacteria bacterium]|nr:hypothetical protein [Deltaproteobacteria bacterium]
MRKVSVDKLEPGMKLAKPVMAASGIALLGEGTELNEKRIERIRDMNITAVVVEGVATQVVPKEEMLNRLDARFKNVEDKPYMNMLKKAVKEHIEGLYE